MGPHLIHGRGIFDHCRRDAGQLRDFRGDLAPRINEGMEFIQDIMAAKGDSPHLNDGIASGVQSGGFNVDDDALIVGMKVMGAAALRAMKDA